jgi:hypothetical protein
MKSQISNLKSQILALLGLLLLPFFADAQTMVRVQGPTRSASSIGSTNGYLTVTTNPCVAYTLSVQNNNASDLWLLVFDGVTTNWVNTNYLMSATNGWAPSLPPVKVFAGLSGGWDWPQGRVFTNSLRIAVSTTDAFWTNVIASCSNSYFDATFYPK